MFNKNRAPSKLLPKHLIRLIQIRNDPKATWHLQTIQLSDLDIIRQAADPFHNFPFQISTTDIFLPTPYLEAEIKRFSIALVNIEPMKPEDMDSTRSPFHLLWLDCNLDSSREGVNFFISI